MSLKCSLCYLHKALMDILQQDRRESAEQRQELCDIITRLQGELQGTEEQRDKVNPSLTRIFWIVVFYLFIVGASISSFSYKSKYKTKNLVCSWSHSASSYSWRWELSSWTGRRSRREVCPISTKSWNWRRREIRSVWAEGLNECGSLTYTKMSYINILLNKSEAKMFQKQVLPACPGDVIWNQSAVEIGL